LAGPAGGVDRAEAFAEPEGRAVPPLPDRLAAAELPVPELAAAELWTFAGCVLEGCVLEGRALEGRALDRDEPDRRPAPAVARGWWFRFADPVAGLNVATDSMAPATRQTARMLASSGITVPCPANGAVSLRSRRRRRWARCSRW
jgi:hypothetical protein